jgi:hypothetical protein
MFNEVPFIMRTVGDERWPCWLFHQHTCIQALPYGLAAWQCSHAAVFADRQGPGAEQKATPHAFLPGRGMVSIQQLVAQLTHLTPGTKPSTDRLTRIAQAVPYAANESNGPKHQSMFQVNYSSICCVG